MPSEHNDMIRVIVVDDSTFMRRAITSLLEQEQDIKVVATGGLARLIADNTDMIDVVDGQLILDGLRIIYERYKREQKE